jgi:hypothetical protein
MEEIGKKAKSGESFNAQRVFTNYTFDTVGNGNRKDRAGLLSSLDHALWFF